MLALFFSICAIATILFGQWLSVHGPDWVMFCPGRLGFGTVLALVCIVAMFVVLAIVSAVEGGESE